MDKRELEELVRQVLLEHLGGGGHGVRAVPVPALGVDESHRMDTGNPGDRVYTRDLFTLEQSPRLGAGIMEMTDTTFPWTLNYDEMDYVVSGRLDVLILRGQRAAGRAHQWGEDLRRAGGGALYPQGQRHPVLCHRPRPVFVLRLSGGLAEPGRRAGTLAVESPAPERCSGAGFFSWPGGKIRAGRGPRGRPPPP